MNIFYINLKNNFFLLLLTEHFDYEHLHQLTGVSVSVNS